VPVIARGMNYSKRGQMPKVEQVPKVNLTPQQELAIKLFEEFKATFVKLATSSKDDPMLFSRMTVVALSQLAAVVAVDIGMQTDQFVNVCRCNFEEAFKAAPKFG
jgi:hypothetical protein